MLEKRGLYRPWEKESPGRVARLVQYLEEEEEACHMAMTGNVHDGERLEPFVSKAHDSDFPPAMALASESEDNHR